jgi:hypothetical protein
LRDLAALGQGARGLEVATLYGVMKTFGIVCGALLAGCGHSVSPGPDTNTCTSGSGCGLFVPWRVNPDIPSTLATGATIESATFRMSSLRVIGDAGASDPSTTQQSFAVTWDGTQAPVPVAFSTAPSGLYSKVSLAIDGAFVNDSYLITGHAVSNGTTYSYTIHDAFALSVDLSANAQLDPGGATSIPIKIDLASCIGAVDWNLVHLDNGVLNLDTDDDWLPFFRQLLISSFSIDGDR